MKYIIYITTNTVNRAVYIGKHQTLDINDNYLGSGKLLVRAVEKYGRENFVKEVLHVFDNEVEMNDKEAELVTEDFCKLDSNYNLCPGGQGGWGYINLNKLNGTTEGRLSGGRAQRGKIRTDEFKKYLSMLSKENQKNKKIKCISEFNHLAHSDNAKRKKTRNKNKFQQGKNNSQYQISRIWINDGKNRKRILPNDVIPDGFVLGFKFCSIV